MFFAPHSIEKPQSGCKEWTVFNLALDEIPQSTTSYQFSRKSRSRLHEADVVLSEQFFIVEDLLSVLTANPAVTRILLQLLNSDLTAIEHENTSFGCYFGKNRVKNVEAEVSENRYSVGCCDSGSVKDLRTSGEGWFHHELFNEVHEVLR